MFFSLFIISIATFINCKRDFYSSFADLEFLLNSESSNLNFLKKVLLDEQRRLDNLNSEILKYEEFNKLARQNVSEHLSSPINAFILIKRMSQDWRNLISSLNLRSKEDDAKINKISSEMPGDDDLKEAAIALVRLQDMYKINTTDFAKGHLSLGSSSDKTLSLMDCFEIGRQLYFELDYYHSTLWMQQALKMLEENEDQDVPISKVDILEFLAYTSYLLGNPVLAHEFNEKLLFLDSQHPRASGNKKYYLKDIQELKEKDIDKFNDFNASGMAWPSPITSQNYDTPQRQRYQDLCTGAKKVSEKKKAKLFCRYTNHFKRPALIFNPVKEEIASFRPFVRVFHDLLNDHEIERLKELAIPRLNRATAFNSKTNQYEAVDYRISKSAWLKNYDDKLIQKISKKIGDITGLDQEYSEDLQIASYGIGGHYDPHFDHGSHNSDHFDSDQGNRIATFMFYLSDVEAGGYTVFIESDAAIKPTKGSAVFWHNLKYSGYGNPMTLHAACPVLLGYKWVANKWIHERGQEFIRKCKPNPNI